MSTETVCISVGHSYLSFTIISFSSITVSINMMSVQCHIWLVLLASTISQCGAIEYYVKPTDFTNITCPGQPCLTINEYTNASAYYIKSNTVFTFLPGKHILLRPIVIRDIENISLTANSARSDTKLSTQFSCNDVNCTSEAERSVPSYGDVCCSAITLINVTNASINAMSMEMNIYESYPYGICINGISILNSSNVLIQMNVFWTETNNDSFTVGILAYESSHIFVNGMQISHHWCGIGLYSTNYTTINSSILLNNQVPGLRMCECSTINVLNLTLTNGATFYNAESVQIRRTVDLAIINSVFSYNKRGIVLQRCMRTRFRNLTLHSSNNHNFDYGLRLTDCFMATLTYVYSQSIHLEYCTNITMIHALITSKRNGIEYDGTNSMNISITNSQRNVVDVIADVGIKVDRGENIFMKNMSVALFRKYGIAFYGCKHMVLEYSRFLSFYSITTQQYNLVLLQSAIVSIKNTDIILRHCVFMHNNITSIQSLASSIELQGNVVFANNRALYGAVFVFIKSSSIILSESCNATFQNNSAVDYGGVFYIIPEEVPIMSKTSLDIQVGAENRYEFSFITNCFIHVKGARSRTMLTFSGNTAGKGGDVAFGGSVASGWEGDVNCLDSFKNISDLESQNTTSVISSAPSRVCLCYVSEKDCSIVADPMVHAVYPGETLLIPVVVVGQDFGTVSGSVIAQLMLPSGLSSTSVISLKEGQSSVLFKNGPRTNLNYTFYTNCIDCQAVLVLKTDNAKVLEIMTTEDNQKLNYTLNAIRLNVLNEISENYLRDHEDFASSLSTHAINNFITTYQNKLVFPKELYDYPLYVNVSFRSCPSGFSLTALPPFKCDCNDLLKQMPGVSCTIQDQLISRVGSVWIGNYDNESVVASKYCPFNYCSRNEINITLMDTNSTQHSLADTDVQCNYNHSGVLCGGCQPGLSLVLGSDRCLKCSTNFIFLLLPYAIAGIILVLFIKVFNLTISEGTLNGLIFYANVIKANRSLYYSQTSINPMTLFIAWLNLDLGIETCFVNGLTAYGRTWLQFVFPLYIWSIAILIIILANYSHRMGKLMGNNGVPVLATLFRLSYAKLFNIVLTVLSYTTLHTTDGHKLMWSADGNIVYLGPEHAPLFAVALATLLLLLVPYTLLLLLGHWLPMLNFYIINRFLLKLRLFFDAHYAAFKPRHRYWFGLLLVIGVATLLTSAVVPSDHDRLIVLLVALLSVLLMYWGKHAYCNFAASNYSTAFFLNLTYLNLSKLFANDTNSAVVFNTLTGISLLQFIGLVSYKLVSIAKRNRRVMTFLISKCQKEAAEDDLELFELAEVDREIESDSDEEENLEDGDIDNLPTY